MKLIYPIGMLAGAACLTVLHLASPESSRRGSLISEKKAPAKSLNAPARGFASAATSKADHKIQKPRTETQRRASFTHLQVDLAPYQSRLDELLAAGFPYATARETTEQMIHEDCNKQRADLLARELIPYWSHGYGLDEGTLDEFKGIDQAEWETRVGLFGMDAADAEAELAIGEHGLRTGTGLSSKRTEIDAIVGRFAREAEALRNQVDDEGEPKDVTLEIAKLDHQLDQELDKIMTREEREQFDLRNSPTANAVRSALRRRHVTVSEQEFRALFYERRKLDEKMLQAAESGGDATPYHEAYLVSAERILGHRRMAMLE